MVEELIKEVELVNVDMKVVVVKEVVSNHGGMEGHMVMMLSGHGSWSVLWWFRIPKSSSLNQQNLHPSPVYTTIDHIH